MRLGALDGTALGPKYEAVRKGRAEANKTKYDQSQTGAFPVGSCHRDAPLGGVGYPCAPAFWEAFSQEKNTWLTEE